MKHLYILIFTIISFSLSSQETVIAVWDFDSDNTQISGGTATGLTNTNITWLNSGSADADSSDGAITVDNVSSANTGNYAAGPNIGGTGKYHFSVALNNWNITTTSGSIFQIKFRTSDSKVVGSIKFEENKVSGSYDGDKTRVVGQLFNNTSSGAYKSGGHFGPESLAYSTFVNIGLTLDFDNDTYEFWTGTPNSPTNGKEFYYDFGGVSGNMPSSLSGVTIDHIQLNAVLGTGDTFTVDQIKISSGDYEQTATVSVDVKNKIQIFPTIVDNTLNVISEETLISEIFNISGKRILKSNSSSIDVSDISRGVYIIKVGNRTQKFIKK